MIRIDTTLVLGAGASFPYGYPTGEALLNSILENVSDHGGALFRELNDLGHPPELIKEFGRKLGGAGYDSIDEFLRHHLDRPSFVTLGKQAIAQVLIRCEISHVENEPAFLKPKTGGWYDLLKNALLEESSLDDLPLNPLRIITFNYDRSLEHYLYTTFLRGFPHTENQIVDSMRSIRISHVHGVLGSLPWQQGTNKRAYGSKPTIDDIRNSAAGIRLAHEPRNGAWHATDPIARSIADSKRIIFLGFGFAPSNMRRLDFDKDIFAGKLVTGTRLDVSNAHLMDRAADFSPLAPLIHVPNFDIRKYLKDHETLARVRLN